MKVKVNYFASVAAQTGMTQQEWEGATDLDSLRKQLTDAYPFLNAVKCIYAVNLQVMRENCILHEGDEIAVMPPFAGG